jgi:hypothetical protein
MRPVHKEALRVVVLLVASGWCLFCAFAAGMLGPYDDPNTSRISAAFLAASAVVGLLALWRLVVLLRRHGSENLL